MFTIAYLKVARNDKKRKEEMIRRWNFEWRRSTRNAFFKKICFHYSYSQSSFRFESGYPTSGSTNAAGFPLVFAAVTRPRWPYGISFRSGKSAGVNASARLLLERRKKLVGEGGRRRWRRRNEERADGGGGYNCTIFPEACQLLPGFTNLVDRTKFEGHCSSSSYHDESLHHSPRIRDWPITPLIIN